MTLSNVELEAIEAREKAATPGPWSNIPALPMFLVTVSDKKGRLLAKSSWRGNGREYPTQGEAVDNFVFIAYARTDIPTLLTALRERDAEIAGLRKDIAIKRRALLATRPLVQNFAGDSDDNNRIYELVCAALSQDKGT